MIISGPDQRVGCLRPFPSEKVVRECRKTCSQEIADVDKWTKSTQAHPSPPLHVFFRSANLSSSFPSLISRPVDGIAAQNCSRKSSTIASMRWTDGCLPGSQKMYASKKKAPVLDRFGSLPIVRGSVPVINPDDAGLRCTR